MLLSVMCVLLCPAPQGDHLFKHITVVAAISGVCQVSNVLQQDRMFSLFRH